MTVAPRKILLPLLPSGPDGIRGFLPHGAGPPVRDFKATFYFCDSPFQRAERTTRGKIQI